MKKNVLVFPCGSEIALEVYRSLDKSTYFNLIGASSVSDHGRFVFKNYIDGVPFVDDDGFIQHIKSIVKEYNIDYIYPAMDSAIAKLKENEEELGCYVIASPSITTQICLSKSKTYKVLEGSVKLPQIYKDKADIVFPVFCKPDIGYGSRGAAKIENYDELNEQLKKYPSSLILEYLSGDEYTVDCFTDRTGKMIFYGPRKRNRISNGISVNTYPINDTNGEFKAIAEAINEKIEFRGAWFVQLKRNLKGEYALLEIASRLGGSSSLFRARGINFAQLNLFDAMGYDVSIIDNKCNVEIDRALDVRYNIDIEYDEVFIDYDDTIILEKQFFNTSAMQFIYQCKNKGIKITLLSAHEGDLDECLKKFGIERLFDRVLHISPNEKKSDYIDNIKSIFIDDSFKERNDVAQFKKIPVFSVDMLNMLIEV